MPVSELKTAPRMRVGEDARSRRGCTVVELPKGRQATPMRGEKLFVSVTRSDLGQAGLGRGEDARASRAPLVKAGLASRRDSSFGTTTSPFGRVAQEVA